MIYIIYPLIGIVTISVIRLLTKAPFPGILYLLATIAWPLFLIRITFDIIYYIWYLLWTKKI